MASPIFGNISPIGVAWISIMTLGWIICQMG